MDVGGRFFLLLFVPRCLVILFVCGCVCVLLCLWCVGFIVVRCVSFLCDER